MPSALLKKLVTEHLFAALSDPVDFLSQLYADAKKQSSNYSYRQFSQDLGFGFTNYLHLILSKKRKLSGKAALRIARELDLRGPQKKQFLGMVKYALSRTQSAREGALSEILDARSQQLASPLDRGQIEYLSQWYHPVIREILSMQTSIHTPEWIATHIFPPLEVEIVRDSLKLLERIGYIAKERNRYVLKDVHVRTPAEIEGMAIVKYHYEMITRAKESLTQVHAFERDISAMTVPMSTADVSEVKMLVQEFQKSILSISEKSQSADRVYQINIQLFPFSIAKEPKS